MKYVRNVIVMLVVIFLQLLVLAPTRAATLVEESTVVLQGTTNKFSHAYPTVAGWDYEWTENGYDRNRTYTEIRDGGYIYMAVFPTGAYQNQMLNFRQHKTTPNASTLGFQIKASHTQNFGSMEYSASLWKDKRYECAFQYWYGSNQFVWWKGNRWEVLPLDINQSKYLIWQIRSSQQYTFKAECDIRNGIKPLFIQVNQYRLDLPSLTPVNPVTNKYSEFVSQHIQLNGDSKGSFGAVRVDTLNTFTYTR